MKIPTCRIVLAAVAALALPFATAQDAPQTSVSFDGTEVFGQILHSFKLEPLDSLDAALKQPDKTLVIIFGDFAKLPDYRASLKDFCKDGGGVLLATDQPDSQRLPFRLRCGGEQVHATGSSVYRKLPRCPVITNWADDGHPICKGLAAGLATNAPSFLQGGEPPLRLLGTFGDDCKWSSILGDFELPANAGYIFASPKDAPPDRRAVVLAGHGVFLNGMLVQSDNSNFAFAWNTVRWLLEGPKGKRERVLFIEDGVPVLNLALPLTRLPPMPVPPIQVINRMIRGLEEENIFNRLLTENVGKIPYLRVLFMMASAIMLTWGVWRLMHGRFRLDTALPAIVGKWQVAPAVMSVVTRRLEELRRQGNLWEPAQVLARQFFLDHANVSAPLWEDANVGPPSVEATGGFFQRMKMKSQVSELWGLASSSPARAVSSRRFDRLLRVLAEVNAAVSEGRLRFECSRHAPRGEATRGA